MVGVRESNTVPRGSTSENKVEGAPCRASHNGGDTLSFPIGAICGSISYKAAFIF